MLLAVQVIGWVFVVLALAGAVYTLLSAAIIGRFAGARMPPTSAVISGPAESPLAEPEK